MPTRTLLATGAAVTATHYGLIALSSARTLDGARRAARSDTTAGRLLWPYAGWVASATALNASIARRNRPRRTS